jgi:hypothetical protein
MGEMEPADRGVFYSEHVPALWEALIGVFPHTVVYNYIEGGLTEGLQAIVNEGVEGEQRSPGRYTHMLIRNADLTRLPQKGDWVTLGTSVYEVVNVDSMLVDISRLVLQANKEFS